MKLTTKGRYAVTAMLDLALFQDQGAVTLADIAKRQQISLAYLEQLFGRLRRKGLVESVRGPGGGYHLAQPEYAIRVSDIIAAVNEPISTTICGGEAANRCKGENVACLTHDLWEALGTEIQQFLNGVTLAALVAQHHEKQFGQEHGSPLRDHRMAREKTVVAVAGADKHVSGS
ncbi:Rrf2 family transcriptional regulator [Thermithiobacillus plumbiphilus]|uniref:Rrf2 family transcriptional regulator n=1 Tax=Thermithiobacillus plumbiphilus TaxID=1729899 RepID=A0ABU9DCX1_9PROT